jgi:hypothetical protein
VWDLQGAARRERKGKKGNEVLKQYNIPMEEEMAHQGNDGWSDDGEPIDIPDDLDGERMDEGV